MLSTGVAPWLNLVGLFAFALSGALTGVRRSFDVVGMAVLATAAALGGGILRDVLLEVPVVALVTPSWLLLPLAATVVVFFFHPVVSRLARAVDVVDAVGLGLFCATATAKALAVGAPPVAAVFLGTVTGVGGGVLRDVLAGTIPSLFRPQSRLYAVPAVAGCLALVVTARGGPVTDVAVV
ncbi:MAG: TRIC cation channel family protein, partial [Actinomycetota bacterium]|nr:TRIC cation channel family protein [Actinomycetota bacterium]